MTVLAQLLACSAPEADALLTGHPRWRGADDGYSIGLPDGRTIWLMADGFVGEVGASRAQSTFVNNTVGVQHGTDPTSATFDMHWEEDDGEPIAFFRDPSSSHWFWPGHGAVVGDALILFFARVTNTDGAPPWNFRHDGWRARVVDDWRLPPDQWRPRDVLLPESAALVEEGSGAVLVHEGRLYLYGYGQGGTVVTRWTVEDAAQGDLRRPEWWDGTRWTDDLEASTPAVLMTTAPEFTVHYEERLGCFVHVHCHGMEHASLRVRTAPRPEGPWSEEHTVFTPPESGVPGRFLYAGKAHPHLTGADLWLTYVVNDHTPEKMVADESIYYPRFVRVTFPT